MEKWYGGIVNEAKREKSNTMGLMNKIDLRGNN